MPAYTEITLHYFDVRGRGQFIRGLLTQRDIPFSDDRIKLNANNSNWPEIRSNRAVSGDFQKLPALQWDDMIINEVLVILAFIQEKLGDNAQLDEKTRIQHAMLTSSAFLDLLTPCLNLIWCDIFHPGTDVAETTAVFKRRLQMHLATVNQTLQQWGWLNAMKDREVMVADAVLWEALDMIRLTCNGKVSLDHFEALATFYDACPGATTFQQLLALKPSTITARPGETEALAVIHESLNSTD